ncbi:MAG: hypothetical protein JO271_00510, partial [Verrucomicrobia bacterium]|nr:hypothetical protein [Verrucomicrobiota bacterium]
SSNRHHGKILDFLYARPTLLEEAKAKEAKAKNQSLDLEEAVRAIGDRTQWRIDLPDPFTDALLLLVLAAAVLLGLLVISGFG